MSKPVGPYTPIVRAGDWLVVSGQIGAVEGKLVEGTYRITFDTNAYFGAQDIEGFYPEASIIFVVKDAEAHYHVPLLLSPFGYSTYRGS